MGWEEIREEWRRASKIVDGRRNLSPMARCNVDVSLNPGLRSMFVKLAFLHLNVANAVCLRFGKDCVCGFTEVCTDTAVFSDKCYEHARCTE